MCSWVTICFWVGLLFFFQAEDGIRDLVRSRGLGDVYKRQTLRQTVDIARNVHGLGAQGHVAGDAAGAAAVGLLSLIHI